MAFPRPIRWQVASVASLAAAALVVAPVQAQLLDDFNRADAGTLGPSWTQVAGTSSIVGNRATGSNLSLATYNGGSGNSVTFDLFAVGDGLQYVAAVLGYGGGSNFFIKVQNNGGAGGFDRYGFYTGNNNVLTFQSLTSLFQSATVTASYFGSIATLRIAPNVGAEQVYQYDYGFTPTGTGIGLGFYGAAQADNFGVDTTVPEPATMTLLATGLAGLAAARRRKQKA